MGGGWQEGREGERERGREGEMERGSGLVNLSLKFKLTWKSDIQEQNFPA